MSNSNILETILAHKAQEVRAKKAKVSLEALKAQCQDLPPCRDFVAALEARVKQQQAAIIAEVKKASPSKGVIKADFDPLKIARHYENNDASCISVLTDEKFFQGHDDYLQQIKQIVSLPLLRKDFIIDEYQIYESRVLGADCILLIVAALSDQQLRSYCTLAQDLGMAVLVESHDNNELQRALILPTPLMGINNRDLKTFHTDLKTTINLLIQIPPEKLVISESGISTQQDIEYLSQQGVYAFLIGESLMRSSD